MLPSAMTETFTQGRLDPDRPEILQPIECCGGEAGRECPLDRP